MVIATDGQDSFAMFAYPENGIQWIQGIGKNPNMPDARAQAGFVSGDNRFYTLKGSGSDQVSSLNKYILHIIQCLKMMKSFIPIFSLLIR